MKSLFALAVALIGTPASVQSVVEFTHVNVIDARDSLADIRNTRRIVAVVANGRLIDASERTRLLALRPDPAATAR